MTEVNDVLKQYLTSLKMPALKLKLAEVLMTAEREKLSYQDFLVKTLQVEFEARQEKAFTRRLKQSNLAQGPTIENFDFTFQTSITEKAVKQLLAFEWLEQAFNLIFLGPPGVGKSHLANALGLKAVAAGYRVLFISMEDLVFNLKTEKVIKKSAKLIKRLKKCSLIIVDEVGYLPVNKEEANNFFKLITDLYEQNSLIITSNLGFSRWAEIMGDQVITTAILDRLMHHSEIFNLEGKSYRLEHRETILGGNI